MLDAVTTDEGGGQLAAPNAVRKVCLLGTSVSTFQMAPVHDPEWEIWTWGNGLLGLPPRITRYFELHEPRYFLLNNSGHYDLLRKAKFPIRTLYDAPDWPTATKLPRALVEERFGPELLTSTVAWALACCIVEQVPVIGIFGVDAACNDDYAYQRPAIFALKKIAEVLGIKVGICDGSDLNIRIKPYPENMDSPLNRKLFERRAEHVQRRDELDKTIAQLTSERDRLNGQIEEQDYIWKWEGMYRN